jgi:hypothetical protein
MQSCSRSQQFASTLFKSSWLIIPICLRMAPFSSSCSKRCDPPQDGFATWNFPMNRQRKERWFSLIDSPLFRKLSYVNTRFSNVHCGVTITKMAWSGEYNCPLFKHLSPLPAPLHPFQKRPFPVRHSVYARTMKVDHLSVQVWRAICEARSGNF